jgi:hypothetical protein
MKAMILTLLHKIVAVLRERCHLSLEMLALRHQRAVLERSGNGPNSRPWIGVCGSCCQLCGRDGRTPLPSCKRTPYDVGDDKAFDTIGGGPVRGRGQDGLPSPRRRAGSSDT